MTETQPFLEYGRNPSRRRFRTRLVAILLIAATTGYVVWRLLPVGTQIARYREQSRAASYLRPASAIVYTEHRKDVDAAPGEPWIRWSYPGDGFSGYAAVNPAPPARAVNALSHGSVFLHERVAGAGLPPRIVSVDVEGANRRSADRAALLMFYFEVTQPGSLLRQPRLLRGTLIPSGDIMSIPFGMLRVFAGQPDPNDASRFTIAYDAGDLGRGTIDGRLMPDDTVTLAVRDGPAATQPSTSRPPSGAGDGGGGGRN
jgi:hypothetical protein